MSENFIGHFDDYAIWNTALSAEEIRTIYNLGRTCDLTKNLGNYTSSEFLQAFWRFDAQNGADSSGKGRHLTWSGTPAYSTSVKAPS